MCKWRFHPLRVARLYEFQSDSSYERWRRLFVVVVVVFFAVVEVSAGSSAGCQWWSRWGSCSRSPVESDVRRNRRGGAWLRLSSGGRQAAVVVRTTNNNEPKEQAIYCHRQPHEQDTTLLRPGIKMLLSARALSAIACPLSRPPFRSLVEHWILFLVSDGMNNRALSVRCSCGECLTHRDHSDSENVTTIVICTVSKDPETPLQHNECIIRGQPGRNPRGSRTRADRELRACNISARVRDLSSRSDIPGSMKDDPQAGSFGNLRLRERETGETFHLIHLIHERCNWCAMLEWITRGFDDKVARVFRLNQ